MVQNSKIIILTLFISLFVFVPVILFSTTKISRIGKEKVTIQYAPSLMNLSINGKKARGTDHYLSKGKYVISIEHPDFEKKEVTINVPDDKEAFLVSGATTEKGTKIIKNNKKYTREIDIVNYANITYNNSKISAKYPFLELLPIDSFGSYKIGSGYVSPDNKKGTQAIYVSAHSPKDRQKALNTIAQKLANPSEIEIIFSNSYNPFKK